MCRCSTTLAAAPCLLEALLSQGTTEVLISKDACWWSQPYSLMLLSTWSLPNAVPLCINGINIHWSANWDLDLGLLSGLQNILLVYAKWKSFNGKQWESWLKTLCRTGGQGTLLRHRDAASSPCWERSCFDLSHPETVLLPPDFYAKGTLPYVTKGWSETEVGLWRSPLHTCELLPAAQS